MNRFAPGTFTPDPRPATVPKMLAAQFALELKLLLRNGEQLLLTLFIPITLLIGLTLLPFGSFGPNRAATFVPAIMALAVISTAFTGQAIAVAFDRRYGALKRIGATALPVWGIIAGKSLAVVTVVFLQSIVLGAIGFALGWRPHIVGLMLGAVIIALGTAGFAAMGLLLGGTLRAEIVLAVANLLWFVFAGLGALTLEGQAVPEAVRWAARLTPSGALTEALTQAMSLSVDWFGLAVLAVVGRGVSAVRTALVPLHLTRRADRRRFPIFRPPSPALLRAVVLILYDRAVPVGRFLLRLVDLLPMPSLRAQRLIAAAVVLTQGGIAVTGAIVRVTASGLGCPTWPQCFPGSFTPVPHAEVPGIHQAVEFGNRMITFLVVLTAALAVLAVTRARRRREVLVYAWLMPASTVMQAVIGGITVLTGLLWWTVAIHLLVSMAMVWLAVLLYVKIGEPDDGVPTTRVPKPLRQLTILTAVVLAAQLVSAGPWSPPRVRTPATRAPTVSCRGSRCRSPRWCTCTRRCWSPISRCWLPSASH